jgi:oxygen-independent coproporphyrinogen-3 oxidase
MKAIAAPLGLYVHIPFCAAICNYCNFNRGLLDSGQKARYVEALTAEIHRAPGEPGPGFAAEAAASIEADTVFFGGGTPSLLSAEEVAAILAACRQSFVLHDDAEITLEANPETVTLESLQAYRAAGVNRISFGVQSFADDELRRLSRLHGAQRAREAYAAARQAGFDNVSLDLMMWLPGQRIEQWLQSVDAAISLEPDHLSLYLLELYPNAPLKDEMARARWSQAPDDDAAEMYDLAMTRLEGAGLSQYEISNVAKPHRRSRHNLKYWQDQAWRGFGCGAHSTRAGVRWKNVSGIDDYIGRARQHTVDAPLVTDVRRLSTEEQLGDALFTGLRLTDGISLSAIRDRYAVDVWERYGAALTPFVDAGLLEHSAGRLTLSRQGMLLAHEVMTVFV